MKNVTPLSIALIVLTIATTLFEAASENAQLLGISSKTLMIISFVLTTAKLIYDQIKLYSEADMTSFAEYSRNNQSKLQLSKEHGKEAIKNWKRYRN